ncbi:MAG: hypothetical protein GXP24_13640 [Planctomycetes bacterium]|nr:hypothetical protein [Planctomycetota bacterium]
MHFGEFLVQQKVLSAHQILKALAEQSNRREFIPLLLVELGALDDYRALRYFTIADQNHSGFLEVLVNEQFISEKQHTQIHDAWQRSGPPLGRLLVEMGFIDEATCAESLEEFEAEKALEENLAKLT